MPHTSQSLAEQKPKRRRSMLTRLCIGVLGLFPMVTAAVMGLVYSLPIALVIAGVGAVTVMSFLPRDDRRR